MGSISVNPFYTESPPPLLRCKVLVIGAVLILSAFAGAPLHGGVPLRARCTAERSLYIHHDCFSHLLRDGDIAARSCAAVTRAGDAGVGKSAIVQMFHSKGTHFPKQYQMTTGCDFVMKEIKLPESNATVELHIYDCAGQAVFKELGCQYWKNANMVMLVYDVTNPVEILKSQLP